MDFNNIKEQTQIDIVGARGCGKTFLTKSILDKLLEKENYNIIIIGCVDYLKRDYKKYINDNIIEFYDDCDSYLSLNGNVITLSTIPTRQSGCIGIPVGFPQKEMPMVFVFDEFEKISNDFKLFMKRNISNIYYCILIHSHYKYDLSLMENKNIILFKACQSIVEWNFSKMKNKYRLQYTLLDFIELNNRLRDYEYITFAQDNII